MCRPESAFDGNNPSEISMFAFAGTASRFPDQGGLDTWNKGRPAGFTPRVLRIDRQSTAEDRL
jgi:hypothetical protein